MQKLHKTIALLIAAALCLTGLALVAAAAFSRADTETKFRSGAGTGDINIKIEVYRLGEDGREVKLGENDHGMGDSFLSGGKVLPGQTVSYITKIVNLAESAWIRVDPDYFAETYIDWFSDDNLVIAKKGEAGNAGSWEKHGEYYYYTEPVASGDSIVFTTAFRVPADLTDDTIPTQGFQILVNADGVQSKHFTPGEADEEGKALGNLFDDDPWFGTLIEECIHHGAYDGGETDDASFAVRFDEGAMGFVKLGQDFFSDWARLMPGDEESGEVLVGNNYDLPVMIYFHVETLDVSDDKYDPELLSALQIEIRSVDIYGEEETVLYSGPLSGATEPVALGYYHRDEETKLIYKVSFDKEYKNAYTLKDTATVWVFSAEIPEELPETGGIGDTVYLIAGTALILAGAAALIIIKKKEDAKI